MILGLEEGMIPNKQSMEDKYTLYEERRLFNMAITRSTKELHLFRKSKKGDQIVNPSSFLNEMGMDNLEIGQMPEVKIRQIQKKEEKVQMKLF